MAYKLEDRPPFMGSCGSSFINGFLSNTMKIQKKKKDEWILPPLKKHVAMIQVSNDISLLQRKISNILLQNAFDDLTAKDKHTILLSSLCDRICFNSKNMDYLQEALRGLSQTTIEWNIVKENGKLSKSWGVASVLANCEVKDNVVTYSYGGVLSEKLKNPEFFTRLDLRMQQKFSSTFGLALYENCLRYADVGQTAWFSVDLLKKLLGAHTQPQYVAYKKFSERVLKKAIDEVNAVSDIQIQPEFRKESRNVVAIQFFVSKNPQASLDLSLELPNAEINEQLEDELQTEFGLSRKQVEQLGKEYAEDYLRSKMQYTRDYAQHHEIKSARSFLFAALSNDYQQSTTFMEKSQRRNQSNSVKAQQQVLEIRQQAVEEQKTAIEDYLSSLSESENDALAKCFAQSLSPTLRSSYQRAGLTSRSIKMMFDAFVSKRLKEFA